VVESSVANSQVMENGGTGAATRDWRGTPLHSLVLRYCTLTAVVAARDSQALVNLWWLRESLRHPP
jgi:hypothetical protein